MWCAGDGQRVHPLPGPAGVRPGGREHHPGAGHADGHRAAAAGGAHAQEGCVCVCVCVCVRTHCVTLHMLYVLYTEYATPSTVYMYTRGVKIHKRFGAYLGF